MSTTTFNTDGTVQAVEDPKSQVTYFEYDALGRKTKEVHHYDVAVNSGNPSGTDDNQTIVYTYANGLLTTMTAKMPNSADDQTTTYTYGTVKGASAGDSKIATGHLLQKVTYPDDAGGNRGYVLYAYNAQGQILWQEDQAGSVLEFVYDTAGRETARKATTVASGFDGAVKRIERTYDGLSRPVLVTQYDAASSGSVVDETKTTYDDWGPVLTFQIDRDSAVAASAGNEYNLAYAYTKATGARQTVRRTGITLPSGKSLTLTYGGASSFEDLLSRVLFVKDGALRVAGYRYQGTAQVVMTEHPEIYAESAVFDATPAYTDLDIFGRITRSKWSVTSPTALDFYKVDLTYDRNSNITWVEDKVHTGMDVKYTMDDLNRLVKAEEGTKSGGSIASPKRTQDWTTLSHTGNWERVKYDLNGDGDFVDTNEYDDTRTHTKANAIATQDVDSNSSVNYTLTHDLVGNLTNDNHNYKYEWDVFGRLRKVKNQSNALVAEYRYNGLGFRIAWHEDSDSDGDVDSNDKWYYCMFDEAWRQVAVFRESDTSPKEEFVPHLAGLDGMGGSSMLDAVACRYRDANSGWTSAADGTLEERKYLLQNWRGDVSVIVDSSAGVNEYAKYSAYGIPFALPAGDADSDGDCDSTDTNQIQTWINGSSYDVRGDLDLDGDVDATDKTNAVNNYSGTTLAWNVLSKSSLANRRGYAGYEKDVNLASFWHVRHRVLDSQLGRWLRRDPADYIDGQSLYAYVNLQALRYIDPQGLMTVLSGPIGSTAGTSSGGQVDCAFPMGPQGGTASGPQPGPPATSGPAQDPETRPLGDCCKSLAFPPGAFARVICCKTKPTVCMNSQAFMPLIRFPYSLPDLALYSCVRDLEDKKASMLTCTHANGTKVGDGGNPVTVDVPPPGLGPLGTEAFEAINMSKVEIESHKNLQKCLRNYKTFCGQSVECNSKFMEYITGIENWINVKKIGLEVNQGFYDGFKISGR